MWDTKFTWKNFYGKKSRVEQQIYYEDRIKAANFANVDYINRENKTFRHGRNTNSILKRLRYISRIFDEKEQELQIGFPTDVKHVAHILGDDSSANKPSWMSGFKSTEEVSSMPANNSTVVETKRSSSKSAVKGVQDMATGLRRNSPTRRSSNGSKQSRRHRSGGASDDMTNQDQSGSSKGLRRSRKSSNQEAESESGESAPVPKHSRHRRSKGSSGGASSRSFKSRDQTSLTDLPFSDLGSGSESVHKLKKSDTPFNSVLQV